MQPFGLYAPTMVIDGATLPISDYVELNGLNLASHTTALEQSVLGKPHLVSTANGLALQPPTSSLGKRSRSNSDASSSSSSSGSVASHHASVFSVFDNDGSEAAFDSQTSLGEQTPSSRKSSMSSTSIHPISQQQQLEQLAAWRAELLASSESSDREHCAKRIRNLQSEVVRLASEVVHVASQPVPQPAQPAAAPHAVPGPSISPASSSTSSSSSEGSKTALVDCLVDAACRTLDSIWAPSTACDLAKGQDALPLQVFVRETLRRGRTSCSTLQAALLYCVRLGRATEASKQNEAISSPSLGMTREEAGLTRCPRRMFLASVITASKFVQDRCYSNRAWSKISGLSIKDLGKLERAFLKAIDYQLVVPEGDWEAWTAELKRTRFGQHAASTEAHDVRGRRSSLSRSQSDNVTGAGVAPDTELRAASPFLPSQVQPKYRHLGDDQQLSLATAADPALPFPRAGAATVSAEL
ncbi:Cyclin PHO80-like protein [Kalmanozyma brasiliensis GHG001]|uniref:Cyclin n=1 Tax=Kalmanozyma brasiliensis (strain GHG001) TaxID=1365824 RepID=V5ES46_KALBG|nr:Cyclin PHO80-like protein [Kalmanozyma brasiliensis GHG001]EST05763.1 Cyclin PHO80-like protein [Kalmanozyma brasiliensis GHG001]